MRLERPQPRYPESDPYVMVDGYRNPRDVDDAHAEYDEQLRERQLEHAPAQCWECRHQREWLR